MVWFIIGPLWQAAHAPTLKFGGITLKSGGTSSKNVRPRFSDAVRPAGNPAGPARKREEQHFGRAEEPGCFLLEVCDQVQFSWRDGARGLSVLGNGPQRLILQRGLTSVQHEHRIECRRIQRRRNAPPHRDLSDLGMVLHLDVVVQPNPHQDRGALQHARDVLSVSKAIAVLIIAAVMNEERDRSGYGGSGRARLPVKRCRFRGCDT